jgi:hypothetical protein
MYVRLFEKGQEKEPLRASNARQTVSSNRHQADFQRTRKRLSGHKAGLLSWDLYYVRCGRSLSCCLLHHYTPPGRGESANIHVRSPREYRSCGHDGRAAGNTYLAGSTTSATLPATAGVLQTQFTGGNCEVLKTAGGGSAPDSLRGCVRDQVGSSGKRRTRNLLRWKRQPNLRHRDFRGREREHLLERGHVSQHG